MIETVDNSVRDTIHCRSFDEISEAGIRAMAG